MPKVPKPPHRGPTRADVNRYFRVPQVRDRALRAVDKSGAAPPATHDGLRQTLVLLFQYLFLSPKSETEIALEYFRCSRHLIEGGDVDTLPLTLVSREVFKRALTEAIEHGSILNDRGDSR